MEKERRASIEDEEGACCSSGRLAGQSDAIVQQLAAGVDGRARQLGNGHQASITISRWKHWTIGPRQRGS